MMRILKGIFRGTLQPPLCAWIAVAAAVLLFSVVVVRGESLAEYKSTVSGLRVDVGRLLYPEEELSGLGIAKLEEDVLVRLGEFNSEPVKVEFDGGEVEVDNSWIRDRLAEYRPKSASYEERHKIFTIIYERLAAIEGKLDELGPSKGAGGTKDETKRRIKQILAREEFRGPSENTEDSIAARILKWIADWFRALFPPREMSPAKMDTGGLGTLGYILQIALYALVLGVVGFLIYKFAPLALRRRRKQKGSSVARVVLGEKIAPDTTPDELFAEAESLAREGHLREALRKGYIALLFGLGEKKAIGLAQHKTNRDYLRELRGRTELHGLVAGLTASYERHWYGAEEADDSEWKEFRGGCAEAVRSRGR